VRGQQVSGATGEKASPGRRRRVVIWSAVGAAVLLVGSIALAAAVYTERPQFCPTCHEMQPYYDAWSAGPHATAAACVDCHIDSGIVAHGLHKFVALKEVWDHFTKTNTFPTWGVDLPNRRCVACHPRVSTKSASKFDHGFHTNKAQCKDCHATTGHEVSLSALATAGVLAPSATGLPAPTGQTPSAAPGHIKVACQRCHDQARMRCSQCHSAPHEARGECSGCHQTGTTFVFSHPASGDCATCHKPPANHFSQDCAACHKPGVPFANATFTHPPTGEHGYRSFACVRCHPKGFTSASCTCHGGRPPSGD
jgi:cytochrome c nitrite reductase small subunit